MTTPGCWMGCTGRFLLLFCTGYLVIQIHQALPGTLLREAFTTLVTGVACLCAVSAGLVSMYCYMSILLLVLGYLGAHWQYFAAKKHLRAAFPGRNPSSHSVNQSLDKMEMHKQWHALVPLIFLITQLVRFAWYNALAN